MENEFREWALQFVAIQDRHVEEFLRGALENLSLYEMKCKFSEIYQREISFSYSLQVEEKDTENTFNRVAFYSVLQEKRIVKNLYLKKIEGDGNSCNSYYDEECGENYGCGEYGTGHYWGYGWGYGDHGDRGNSYGSGFHDGAGNGFFGTYGNGFACGSGIGSDVSNNRDGSGFDYFDWTIMYSLRKKR